MSFTIKKTSYRCPLERQRTFGTTALTHPCERLRRSPCRWCCVAQARSACATQHHLLWRGFAARTAQGRV